MENLTNEGRQGKRVCCPGHVEDRNGIKKGRRVGTKSVDRNLRLLVPLGGSPKKPAELIGNTIAVIMNPGTVSNLQALHRSSNIRQMLYTENQSRKSIQFQTAQ
jgi:hypothetical protein